MSYTSQLCANCWTNVPIVEAQAPHHITRKSRCRNARKVRLRIDDWPINMDALRGGRPTPSGKRTSSSDSLSSTRNFEIPRVMKISGVRSQIRNYLAEMARTATRGGLACAVWRLKLLSRNRLHVGDHSLNSVAIGVGKSRMAVQLPEEGWPEVLKKTASRMVIHNCGDPMLRFVTLWRDKDGVQVKAFPG